MRRETGGIGTAGASRTGNRRNRNSRGEPDGPEEPGQVGQVGQVGGTGRAGGTGTGRAGWAGNTETSQAGRNRPEQKKPGAENRSGLNRYRQAWLQQLFGQRPYAGCITEPQDASSSTGRILVPGRALRAPAGCITKPQDASFLNRPHPCPRPRASGSSRAHPAPPNTTQSNRRTPHRRTAKPPYTAGSDAAHPLRL